MLKVRTISKLSDSASQRTTHFFLSLDGYSDRRSDFDGRLPKVALQVVVIAVSTALRRTFEAFLSPVFALVADLGAGLDAFEVFAGLRHCGSGWCRGNPEPTRTLPVYPATPHSDLPHLLPFRSHTPPTSPPPTYPSRAPTRQPTATRQPISVPTGPPAYRSPTRRRLNPFPAG